MEICIRSQKGETICSTLRVFVDILDLIKLARVDHLTEVDDKLFNNFRHAVLRILRCTAVAHISFIFGIKSRVAGRLVIGLVIILQIQQLKVNER